MNSIPRALDWLTHFSPSEISFTTLGYLDNLTDSNLTQPQFTVIYEAALNLPSVQADVREQHELLLRAGCLQLQRDWVTDAYGSLARAAQIELDEPNRTLVAQWLLGIAEWRSHQREAAFGRWMAVRSAFEQSQAVATDQRNNAGLAYFREVLAEINAEMASRLEEAYTWYNAFSKSSVSGVLRTLHDAILQDLRAGQLDPVRLRMQDLIKQARRSPDRSVLAETLVQCALDRLQMDDRDAAVEFLTEAIAKLPPHSHHQAVARWMRGAIRVESPMARLAGLDDWQHAIETFEGLQRTANRQREPEKMRWYAARIQAMNAALDRIPV